MIDVIFIGDCKDAALFRAAGVPSFAPAPRHLAERVIAERARCRVLAMTAKTFAMLPSRLARDLREGDWPRLEIVLDPPKAALRATRLTRQLRARAAQVMPGFAA